MDGSFVKVTLDTNIIVSGLVYGGKPEQILNLIQQPQIQVVISPILKAELIEVLIKKFSFTQEKVRLTEKFIEENFRLVYPKISLNYVKDEDDNRVLEVAVDGGCNFIITGDKELLDLGSFQGINILTADQFLKILEEV